MMTTKLNELETTGSVRLYASEGFNLGELMNTLDSALDTDTYSFGLMENNKGEFIEIIKFN